MDLSSLQLSDYILKSTLDYFIDTQVYSKLFYCFIILLYYN